MIDLLFEGEQAHQIKTIGNRHPTYTLYNTQANVFLNPFLLLELFLCKSAVLLQILRSPELYSGLQSLARSSLTSHQNYCILRTSPWLEAVLQVIRTTVLTVILYCTSPWLEAVLQVLRTVLYCTSVLVLGQQQPCSCTYCRIYSVHCPKGNRFSQI